MLALQLSIVQSILSLHSLSLRTKPHPLTALQTSTVQLNPSLHKLSLGEFITKLFSSSQLSIVQSTSSSVETEFPMQIPEEHLSFSVQNKLSLHKFVSSFSL